MKEYLLRFINKRVKNLDIRNKCLNEIEKDITISESWYILNNYKFNSTQRQIIAEYNFNCVKDFNY